MTSGFDALTPSVKYHIVNTLGWRSLRPLQQQAIEPILAGKHAILGAPTAGGKTEAAVFPLLSQIVTERWAGPSVIYLCPLRALLNDLHPRLEHYCGLLGLTAGLWHGDVDQPARRRILKDPPDVLLTTPESIESMMLSTRVPHDELFGGVRAVVIDEIHAFAGDDRGWHTLAVLARLEALARRRLQRIGLTATVGNPDWLLGWLTGGEPGEVVVPPDAAPGADFQVDYVGDVTNAARVMAHLHPGEKRLAFADSRSSVEETATALRGNKVTTFVSHSSLSRDERHQAEQAFAQARDCVIVATSTLELGIDVGDLDRVIQLEAPSKVSSVLQRIGRTGRRPDTNRNCLFLAMEPTKTLQAAAMVQLIKNGWVEELEAPASPVLVVAQQLLARVLTEGRVGRSDWPGSFGPLAQQTGLGHFTAPVADHMVAQGILEEHGGVFAIGPEGERLYGKRHFSDVMSVFTSEPLFVARYGQRDLGYVDPSSLTNANGELKTILLGGRPWDTIEIDWSRRIGWVQPSKDPGKSRWSGGGVPLSRAVCDAMRAVLVDPSPVADALTKRARGQIDEMRSDLPWIEPGKTALVRDPDRDIATWWTFAGAKANAQMAAGLKAAGVNVGATEDLYIKVRDVPSFKRFREAVAESCRVPPEPEIAAQQAAEVKFAACIPAELVAGMLAQRARDDRTVIEVVTEPMVLIA